MKEWPDWLPPKEMIKRQPYLPRFMAGGETNPLGARAMYLGNTQYEFMAPTSHRLSAASCPPAAFV
jgi:lipoprotein-anchoring transpeptidase ErfK/SrfK